jgi:hypothetical protein
MKKILNSPPLVEDNSAENAIRNIAWAQGDDSLIEYLQVKSSHWTPKGKNHFTYPYEVLKSFIKEHLNVKKGKIRKGKMLPPTSDLWIKSHALYQCSYRNTDTYIMPINRSSLQKSKLVHLVILGFRLNYDESPDNVGSAKRITLISVCVGSG